MPIDHFSIRVPAEKWDVTKAFYEGALKPLGYEILATFMEGSVIGMGDQHPEFWLTKVDGSVNAGDGTHFAFRAEARKQVDEFHAAGVSSGGTSNGEGGLRPHYGPNYYGSFVHDPIGNNVEVVTRSPE